MPRPTRIEYEGAFHHVMNRGRSRSDIFHGVIYYKSFLKILKQASERFDAVIHAYCLMSNHYHLLIETPKANLSRIMRHINGVYTQKYNWLKKTDGTLFKGRYKSILVDADEYLLQLTRYIHRNPIETKKPMVKNLLDYPWSSYPAYINLAKSPDWLCRERVYAMLGQKQRYNGYRQYVDQGIDNDIVRYYHQYNRLTILGEQDFRRDALKTCQETNVSELRNLLPNRPGAEEVIELLCRLFQKNKIDITYNTKGLRRPNPERAFAMYACQYYAGSTLKEIGELFNLTHRCSASYPINRIKQEVERDLWREQREALETLL